MPGGSSSDGVWGFAALAQEVKGLGLGPDDVGHSSKPVVFGGWRSRVDDEPDSPEQKEAATAVSIEGEVQVVKPRPLMFDDGVVFSPNAISSPNKRVMHI